MQLKALSALQSVLATVTEGNGSRFVHYCCNPQRFHVCVVEPYGLVAAWGPRGAPLAPRVMLIRGLGQAGTDRSEAVKPNSSLSASQCDSFSLRHEGFVH